MRAAVESLASTREWLVGERHRLLDRQQGLSNEMRRAIDRVCELTNQLHDIDQAIAQLEAAGGES